MKFPGRLSGSPIQFKSIRQRNRAEGAEEPNAATNTFPHFAQIETGISGIDDVAIAVYIAAVIKRKQAESLCQGILELHVEQQRLVSAQWVAYGGLGADLADIIPPQGIGAAHEIPFKCGKFFSAVSLSVFDGAVYSAHQFADQFLVISDLVSGFIKIGTAQEAASKL